MTSICLSILLVLAAPDPASAVGELDLRAARDDAQRRLARALVPLRIDQKRTLAEVLDPVVDAADACLPVAHCARDVGKPIVYSDKTVELHVALQPEDVRDEVRRLLIQRKASAVAIRSALDALTDAKLADCLVAAGFASPKPPADSARRNGLPIEAALAEMTTAAAILDARRQLVDRIGQIRIAGHKKLEDVLLQTPGLEDELVKSIPISVFGPTRQKSGGTMEASATLSPQHAIDLIGECMARLSPTSVPAKLALEGGEGDAISVRGIGVRPTEAVLARMGLAVRNTGDFDSAAPSWAGQCLIAEGDARVPGGDDGHAAAVATARDDAEFAARQRLAEQIDALKLPDGRTVRDAVLSRGIPASDLMLCLGGAHRLGLADATPDRRVRVCVRLPLTGLWRLIAAAGNSSPDAPGGSP